MTKIGRPSLPKHEKVEEYIVEFKKKGSLLYSALNIYCDWRGTTIDNLISSGKKEMKSFEQYLKESDSDKEFSNRRARVSCIKQFLRWHGIDIPKYDRSKSRKKYFTNAEDKEIFADFLESFSGDAPSTIQAAKMGLRKYMDYREMTLEQIKKEGNTKSPDELKRILRVYRDEMKETGVKNYYKAFVSYVLRFYEAICYKRIIIRNKTNGDIPRFTNTATIDKESVKKLIEGADERDRMIILALWDTGLNPQDLCNFKYGDLKPLLKDNPENITEAGAIIYTRQKTKIPYIAIFGVQSLRAIARWLKIRREGLLGSVKQEITDKTPIFSQKRFPYKQITPNQLTRVVFVRSEICGFKNPNHFKPAHFRNTYASKLKPQLDNDDFKILFGHYTGVIRHYEDLEPKLEPLKELYEQYYGLFNLDRPDEKYETLERETDKLRTSQATLLKENQELRDELKGLKLVVDKLWEAFGTSVDNLGRQRDEHEHELDRVIDHYEWEKEKEEILRKEKEED